MTELQRAHSTYTNPPPTHSQACRRITQQHTTTAEHPSMELQLPCTQDLGAQ